ncbi:MAG TPA: hypothetical protein VN642_09415 [Dongiaceae bacterium]|nr:hypothetical protein [Dongiaceae bacterium]
MKISSRELLQAPLTADETRWAIELADKLPDDVDLTFEESKILTRLSIREWPDALILKVKDVIDIEDFLVEDEDKAEPARPVSYRTKRRSSV